MNLMPYVKLRGRKYHTYKDTLKLSNKGIIDISKIYWLDKLKNLRKLDLSGNKIIEIRGLETLKNLEILNLSRNNISQINGLEKLSKLKKLDLFENDIVKIEGLEQLNKLEELSLSNNKISRIEGLNNLKNLQRISLYNNIITEIRGLETSINLKELNLSLNEITKIKGLKKLKKLTTLFLVQNNIHEIKHLKKLVNLEILGLSRNHIMKIKGLHKSTNLKRLHLYQNSIKKINGIEKLINLKVLNLTFNQISKIRGINSLTKLQDLHLYGNYISKIEGLENNKNLEFLSLANNKITDGRELIKLLNINNIQFMDFDYDKIEFIETDIQEQLSKFFEDNYTKYYRKYIKIKENFTKQLNSPPSKYPTFKSKIIKLLNNLIGIANILINLYQDEWKKEILFHNELKSLINDRLTLESRDSNEYFKIQALKNVFFASMENAYKEQIRYLKEAINNFHEAGELKCEFFYLVHLLLIESLIAHSEENIDACKDKLKKILELNQKYKEQPFNDTLKLIINELPNIQKKLIDYTCEPHHLKRLITESSKKCDEIIKISFPKLKISKPGIYRILNHIINNMRESWQNVELNMKNYNSWYIRTEEDAKKIWQKIYQALRKIDLKYFPSEIFKNENILNEKIYEILLERFPNIKLNKLISGRIHVDLSDDVIAIEIKKLESNTAKDELIGQIFEDLRIGVYKYGIIFGIDISSRKDLTRFNELLFSDGKIYCIIKPYPY